jgi:hypothetical protein
VFYLKDPVYASQGTKLHGEVSMTRQEKNKRLYNLNLKFKVDEEETETKAVYEIP